MPAIQQACRHASAARAYAGASFVASPAVWGGQGLAACSGARLLNAWASARAGRPGGPLNVSGQEISLQSRCTLGAARRQQAQSQQLQQRHTELRRKPTLASGTPQMTAAAAPHGCQKSRMARSAGATLVSIPSADLARGDLIPRRLDLPLGVAPSALPGDALGLAPAAAPPGPRRRALLACEAPAAARSAAARLTLATSHALDHSLTA